MVDTSKWGLTDTGFYVPTLYEIISEKEKQAKALFGEDFDTGEQTPQGKYIRINAKDELRLYEQAANVYYSISPLTARGISLDRLVKFVAANRNGGTYAKHIVRIYGTKNYEIPMGYLVKNDDDITFWITQNAVINNEEQTNADDLNENKILYYAEAYVQCVTAGSIGNVRTINKTVNADTNITGVSYIQTIAFGEAAESDTNLRSRFNQIIQGLGTNTAAAIKANVLRVENVTNADIIDNNTTSEYIIGNNDLIIAPKTYAVIVMCEDRTTEKKNEIAQAISEKQPLGIIQSGTEIVVTTDSSGIQRVTAFTYVKDNKINISASCYVTSEFPANGKEQIENNIIKYISSLKIGERVVYRRIYDYIFNVVGVDDVPSLKVNNGEENIDISKISIARVGTIDITTTKV